MNIKTCGINQYLTAVASKLNSETTTRMLQFGTKKTVAGQPLIRDAEGMLTTKAGILDAAQNLFSATQGRDELVSKFQNFSVGQNQPSTGYEAVSDVKTIGAIDLTILARAQSIVPFVAVDRTMKNQIDTLYYQDLVAIQGTGDLSAGDVVDGNFKAPNSNVRVDSLRSTTLASGEESAEFGPLVPGSVMVTIVSENKSYKGRDFQGDGQILFPADAKVSEATVDYDTGKIKVTTDLADATIDLNYAVDNQADNTGKETTVVAPKWTAVQLVATEDEIIVQDNLVNRLNMAKVQLLATDGAGGTSPADITFARTKNAYLESINRKVLREIVGATSEPDINYDLKDYQLTDWNTTKNDQVIQLMANMEAKFLGLTGIPLTAIITGSYGVSLLQVIPNMWVANPDAATGLNGLAGYFNGKPVYRHNFLNALARGRFGKKGGYDGTELESAPISYFGIAKLPDNNSGSCVFGEYLPLTSTGVVSNFLQPVNISNGFFSMTGAKLVDTNLVIRVDIIPPTKTFGTTGVGDEKVA